MKKYKKTLGLKYNIKKVIDLLVNCIFIVVCVVIGYIVTLFFLSLFKIITKVLF